MSETKYENVPTELVPERIWLGPAPLNKSGEAYAQSKTLDTLKSAGITHILNCTPDFPSVDSLGESEELGQFRVGVEDVDHAPIADYFGSAADFVHAALSSGGRVYIHCETGKSRSASIFLAYQVKHGGLSLRQAYEDAKAIRPYIQPKTAFWRELCAFERKLRGEISYPLEEYALVYLLDHYIPHYEWVPGITVESVREIFERTGRDEQSAKNEINSLVTAMYD